jgi:hypothetical protein
MWCSCKRLVAVQLCDSHWWLAITSLFCLSDFHFSDLRYCALDSADMNWPDGVFSSFSRSKLSSTCCCLWFFTLFLRRSSGCGLPGVLGDFIFLLSVSTMYISTRNITIGIASIYILLLFVERKKKYCYQ